MARKDGVTCPRCLLSVSDHLQLKPHYKPRLDEEKPLEVCT